MNANQIWHLMELLPMPESIKSCMGLIHAQIQTKLSVVGFNATKTAPQGEKSAPHASIPQPPPSQAPVRGSGTRHQAIPWLSQPF